MLPEPDYKLGFFTGSNIWIYKLNGDYSFGIYPISFENENGEIDWPKDEVNWLLDRVEILRYDNGSPMHWKAENFKDENWSPPDNLMKILEQYLTDGKLMINNVKGLIDELRATQQSVS